MFWSNRFFAKNLFIVQFVFLENDVARLFPGFILAGVGGGGLSFVLCINTMPIQTFLYY